MVVILAVVVWYFKIFNNNNSNKNIFNITVAVLLEYFYLIILSHFMKCTL